MRVRHLLLISALLSTMSSVAQQTQLHLTLRDGTDKPLLHDPKCWGEALDTLPCHAVTVMIENQSSAPVRVDWMACPGPRMLFEFFADNRWQKFPESIDGFVCSANAPQGALVEPHGHYDFPMFLRWTLSNIPDKDHINTLRANWTLSPCKSHFGTEPAFCDEWLIDSTAETNKLIYLVSDPIHIAVSTAMKH